MKNLSFVLWMLLYPLAVSMGNYFDFLSKGSQVTHYSDTEMSYAYAFIVGVWVLVGYLTYEGKPK